MMKEIVIKIIIPRYIKLNPEMMHLFNEDKNKVFNFLTKNFRENIFYIITDSGIPFPPYYSIRNHVTSKSLILRFMKSIIFSYCVFIDMIDKDNEILYVRIEELKISLKGGYTRGILVIINDIILQWKYYSSNIL